MALTIVEDTRAVTGGVDTHADMHVAGALDPIGGLLGVEEFPVTCRWLNKTTVWCARLYDNHKIVFEC
jgi:transposase